MNIVSGDSYREVLYHALNLLDGNGIQSSPREMETKELENILIQIKNPTDRIAYLAGRKANIFATLAETLWVLAGRNDLSFISYYLKRIGDYSDDGTTLSGGYGPRLRNWQGVDQIFRVTQILQNDPESRRAVIILFDPSKDTEIGRRDIPCNNWMQFTIRNGQLNLKVVSRSMDIIWGSTINIFEWTVLQELMSNWLSVPVGEYSHFIGSLHVYKDFYNRLAEIIINPLDRTTFPTIPWVINWESFDHELSEFFEQERQIRENIAPNETKFHSEVLRVGIKMLWSYSLHKGSNYLDAWNVIEDLPLSDLQIMCKDFYLRNPNYLNIEARGTNK